MWSGIIQGRHGGVGVEISSNHVSQQVLSIIVENIAKYAVDIGPVGGYSPIIGYRDVPREWTGFRA